MARHELGPYGAAASPAKIEPGSISIVYQADDVINMVAQLRQDVHRKWARSAPHVVRCLCRVFDCVKLPDTIEVVFHVGKEIQEGLKSRIYTLDKYLGVVRRVKSGRAVKWLEESRLAKHVKSSQKALNILMLMLDVAEHMLIDIKLKQILEVAKRIEGRLEAQDRGKLRAGLQSLREIAIQPDFPRNLDIRMRARERLREAEETYKALVAGRHKREMDDLISKLSKGGLKFSLLHRSENLRGISSMLTETQELLSTIHTAHAGICCSYSDEEKIKCVDEVSRQIEYYDAIRNEYQAYHRTVKGLLRKPQKERNLDSNIDASFRALIYHCEAAMFKEIQVLQYLTADGNRRLCAPMLASPVSCAFSGEEDEINRSMPVPVNSGQSQESPESSLHWLAQEGYTSRLYILVKQGGDVNARDSWGRTPLHWASKNGYGAIIKILLENGANPEAKDNMGLTPDVMAQNDRIREMLRSLLGT